MNTTDSSTNGFKNRTNAITNYLQEIMFYNFSLVLSHFREDLKQSKGEIRPVEFWRVVADWRPVKFWVEILIWKSYMGNFEEPKQIIRWEILIWKSIFLNRKFWFGKVKWEIWIWKSRLPTWEVFSDIMGINFLFFKSLIFDSDWPGYR